MVVSAQGYQQVSNQGSARRNAPRTTPLAADAEYRDCSVGATNKHYGTRREENHAAAQRVRPNPSLEPTRYGRHCKPGLSQWNYRLSPGLQYLPTRAAQLER